MTLLGGCDVRCIVNGLTEPQQIRLRNGTKSHFSLMFQQRKWPGSASPGESLRKELLSVSHKEVWKSTSYIFSVSVHRPECQHLKHAWETQHILIFLLSLY